MYDKISYHTIETLFTHTSKVALNVFQSREFLVNLLTNVVETNTCLRNIGGIKLIVST